MAARCGSGHRVRLSGNDLSCCAGAYRRPDGNLCDLRRDRAFRDDGCSVLLVRVKHGARGGSLKIGVDYRPALLNRTGIGRYTREVVRAMAALEDRPELYLYGHSLRKAVFPPATLGINREGVRFVRKRLSGRAIGLLQRCTGIGIESFLGPIDLFHYTDYSYPHLRRTPFVCTLYDTTFLEPGFFRPRDSAALTLRTAWALAHSRLLLVPSSFTARELISRMGAEPDRITVIHLGADHVSPPVSPQAPDRRGPYILTVGSLEPRKNHIRILLALEVLAGRGISTRWIIATSKGWMNKPFLKRLARSSIRERVEIRWNVSEEEVAILYAGAELTVYASLCEGFGLPPLEAMRCGSPVLSSRVSSMPEVCGDAAYYFDPRCVDSIAEAVEKVFRNDSLRRQLREAGFRRAAQFRWADTARATLAAYRAALLQADGATSHLV